jgi:hypothetical protein
MEPIGRRGFLFARVFIVRSRGFRNLGANPRLSSLLR